MRKGEKNTFEVFEDISLKLTKKNRTYINAPHFDVKQNDQSDFQLSANFWLAETCFYWHVMG